MAKGSPKGRRVEMAPLELEFKLCVTYRLSEATLVRIEGQLVLETLPMFDAHVTAIAQSTPGHVVLDVQDLTFVDSLGARGLLTLWMALEQRGLRMSLFGPRRHVAHLLKFIGLDKIFPVRARMEDAVAALSEWHPPPDKVLRTG